MGYTVAPKIVRAVWWLRGESTARQGQAVRDAYRLGREVGEELATGGRPLPPRPEAADECHAAALDGMQHGYDARMAILARKKH